MNRIEKIRKRVLLGSLFLFLFYSCHQSIDDEEQSNFSITGIQDYYTVYLHLDSSIGTPDVAEEMTIHSDSDLIVKSNISLSSGTRYTLYFSVGSHSDSSLNLLWSGESGTRGLVVYDRGLHYMALPMQRPLKIAFNVNVDGQYHISFNPSTLLYSISHDSQSDLSHSANIINENTISSVHLLSEFPGYRVPASHNQMVLTGETYRIVLTNLVPGVYYPLQFVYNTNTNEALGKQQYNGVTIGNQLLDSLIAPAASQNQYASFRATSERAVVNFYPTFRSFTVDMNESPEYGDGIFDAAFYGPPVLSNQIPEGNVRNLYIRNLGASWYFAIHGYFGATNGLPRGAGGVRMVLFIDDMSDNGGINNTTLSLYDGLSPVTIPAGRSVEYLLVMQSVESGATNEDADRIQDGVKLYGPLRSGMTNWATINAVPDIQKILEGYTYHARNGFYTYNGIYEVVIPMTNYNGSQYIPITNTGGVGVLPTDQIQVCMIAWNAGTNWGNTGNTNLTAPIYYGIPTPSETNELPNPGSWVTVP